MTSRRTGCRVAVTWAVAGLIMAGCSSKQAAAPTKLGPTPEEMLRELSDFIQWSVKDRKRAPSQAADLAAAEALFPGAHFGLVSKEIVYQWGVGLSSGGTAGETVLAYTKDAETQGGWVLMQDGTIKEMTAEQFKAAPKARR